MKIAAAQTLVTRDPKANGAAIRAQMREAARAGARLVLFPECALSGYALENENTDWAGIASELELIRALAAESKLWSVVGCAHQLEGRRPYNSLYVVSDAGGIAARYDKRLCSHNEINNFYSAGRDPVVFEADGFRFGLTLCLELCFPEQFLEYERLGADAVLFSAYSGYDMFAVMARGHAATTCMWFGVSTPVQQGKLPSGVVGPDGYWMAQLGDQSSPGVAVAELDRADPQFDIPLNKARPWRRVAREGKIYGR